MSQSASVLNKTGLLMGPLCRVLRFTCLAIALVTASTGHAAPVLTTFDAGLEGWLVTGDNAMAWSSSGGNPGGCLSVNDLATGALNVAVASQAFLGDWSGAGAADTLSVDIFLHRISGSATPMPFIFRIVGPGGAARAPIGTSFYPVEDAWNHYTVSLSASDWTLESGTWSGLLATVQTLYLAGEFVTGPEDCRIDNAYLSRAPTSLLIPCLASRFNGSDTEDWAFVNTASVSFSATGGNAGGYVRVDDGSGTSRAVAPPSFRGDWTPLDGVGKVRVDLRLLSASGTATGAADFVTLSGPGGAARRALAVADLPPVGPLWKTFEIPIEVAAWTVTSGTWAGLMADVEDVRVTLDFHDGNEVVGFDNVARLGAGCADPDLHLTLHASDLALCGHVSMEALRGVALDPASGEIYGVIDQAPAAYGGLWGVTGPLGGVRLASYDRPAHLVFDPQGNAYVSEDFSGNVYRNAAAGGSSLWVSGFHSGDDDPFGLCIAPSAFDGPAVDPGNVLVADRGFQGADEIYSFSTAAPEGEQLLLPDPGNVDLFDLAPGDDVVYVCDALDSGALKVLSPSGALSDLTLQSPIPDAVSVARDPALKQLYVASGSGSAVHRVTIASGAVELVASGFVALSAGCLEFDAGNRVLWIVDQGSNRVHRVCSTAVIGVEQPRPVTGLRLGVTPNPSRGTHRIRMRLPAPAHARLAVFDLAGRMIRELANRPFDAGAHALEWDGLDSNGHSVGSGVFVLRAQAGGNRVDQKLVRIR